MPEENINSESDGSIGEIRIPFGAMNRILLIVNSILGAVFVFALFYVVVLTLEALPAGPTALLLSMTIIAIFSMAFFAGLGFLLRVANLVTG